MKRFAIYPLALTALLCASCAHQAGGPTDLAAPSEPAFLEVVTDAADYRLSVGGSKGNVDLAPGTSPAQVSPGRYRVAYVAYMQKDASGSEWALATDALPGPFEVQPGETAKLSYGPPLKVQAFADKRGSEVRFNLLVQGQGNEYYSAANILKGGSRGEAPRIEIRDSAGKIVATGAFRYG